MQQFYDTYGAYILFGVWVLITITVARIFSNRIRSKLSKRKDDFSDVTKLKFLLHFVTALIYILGFAIAINYLPGLKTLSASLFTATGIISVAIGFASQNALSNIISGLFIVIFKPFKIGDKLIIKKEFVGIVKDITLRHTVVLDFENRHVIIPNNIINNEILINYSGTSQPLAVPIEYQIGIRSDFAKFKSKVVEFLINHKSFTPIANFYNAKGDFQIPIYVTKLTETSATVKITVSGESAGATTNIINDLNLQILNHTEDMGVVFPDVIYSKFTPSNMTE